MFLFLLIGGQFWMMCFAVCRCTSPANTPTFVYAYRISHAMAESACARSSRRRCGYSSSIPVPHRELSSVFLFLQAVPRPIPSPCTHVVPDLSLSLSRLLRPIASANSTHHKPPSRSVSQASSRRGGIEQMRRRFPRSFTFTMATATERHMPCSPFTMSSYDSGVVTPHSHASLHSCSASNGRSTLRFITLWAAEECRLCVNTEVSPTTQATG